MTSLVDPTSSRRAAFVRGFWKGMAAPLVLFSTFDMPAQARAPEFRPLQRLPVASIIKAVRNTRDNDAAGKK